MIDIGVNLGADQFRDDYQRVWQEARSAGVSSLVITGTSVSESERALQIASELNVYATAGVHPHHADEWRDDCVADIRRLLKHKQCVAVGECGLDFNRNFSTPQNQERAFAAQIAIATEENRPLFLHCRDAQRRFVEIIKSESKARQGVAHCFTGTREEFFQLLDLDLYIGITGWICDERRGTALRELVAEIPLDRLLMETDAPYLLPRNLQPKPASRRNEPKYLLHIAQQIALLRGIELSELIAHTSANAERLFGIRLSIKSP